MVMPQEGELLGRVIKLVGGDNIIVKCTDGKVRTCRIRGKIKRRMWIRDGDLVLVAPWDFQSDRADIIWRYISAHAEKMKADGLLQGLDWFVNYDPNIHIEPLTIVVVVVAW
jgi:translation initiation factor 1A